MSTEKVVTIKEQKAKPESKLATVKAVEPVVVKLGDKEYTLVYDMNAFAELEQEYGTIDEALKKASQPAFRDMRFFLWAGLLHNTAKVDEDGNFLSHGITTHQVGALVKPGDLQKISVSIWEAITRDLKTDELKGPDGKNA